MTSDQSIWASLPIPAFLLDTSDLIADVNSAGEGFLNASRKAVIGVPIWDLLAIDAPIEQVRVEVIDAPLADREAAGRDYRWPLRAVA